MKHSENQAFFTNNKTKIIFKDSIREEESMRKITLVFFFYLLW